jgi:hypothetical protein
MVARKLEDQRPSQSLEDVQDVLERFVEKHPFIADTSKKGQKR